MELVRKLVIKTDNFYFIRSETKIFIHKSAIIVHLALENQTKDEIVDSFPKLWRKILLFFVILFYFIFFYFLF